MLRLCDGPACPRCGCRDSKILEEPVAASGDQPYFAGSDPEKAQAWHQSAWWNAGRAVCRHCGTRFHFRAEAEQDEASDEFESIDGEPEGAVEQIAVESPTHCPACGGSRSYVTRVVARVQYRKCRDCKATKKTVKEE